MGHYWLGIVAAVLLWALVYNEEISRLWHRIFGTDVPTAELEWRKELVQHSGFYGTAVAAVMGFHHWAATVVAVVWFVACMRVSFLLAELIHERELADDKEHRRKVAGMVRSVVRSELERAARLDQNDNPEQA